MAYRVYLLEDISIDNYVELDCENVDFSTIFSVADVSDISSRKDKVTKFIQFKGSKTNNQAFGSMFHLNAVTDFDLDNRLYFNYSPLRTVDCLIYEDSVLLLRGSLRVHEINADVNGDLVYKTYVTGSFIDFREIVNEKYLEDLDFSDLNHRYNYLNFSRSWETACEYYDSTTSQYLLQPFELGKNYVYPWIDYGVTFQKDEINLLRHAFHYKNFRPAIYVKEYFERIFNQEELSGYTYELKGDSDFQNKFNSMIVPNNDEKLVSKSNTISFVANNPGPIHANRSVTWYTQCSYIRTIPIQIITNPSNLMHITDGTTGEANNVLLVDKEFTTSGKCKARISYFSNHFIGAAKIKFELCERDYISPTDPQYNNADSWNVIASSSPVTVPGNSGIVNTWFEFEVGERTYPMNSQVCFRLALSECPGYLLENGFMGQQIFFDIRDVEVKFPKEAGEYITYEVNDGDVINIKGVHGIKQMDFIKSIMALMNLYVYTEKDRPKHLIFQQYDDYYALTSLPLLPSTSLDWSNKIDYSKGFKIKSNAQIPKKYLFTMKDDGDYMNKTYKTAFNEVYGSFTFNDAYGFTDQKKVETIFSPSPLVQYSGTSRVHPAIYSVSGTERSPTKSNIRILYYNGLRATNGFIVGKDTIVAYVADWDAVGAGNRYPQAGNYLLAPGVNNQTPVEDLYFGLAKQMYFDFTTAHQTVSTGYQYYINQVSSITNPNVSFIECEVYLNEVDISNLDLKVPVFIDLGEFGHSYFKVLTVEYENNNTTSRCLLQKIAI